MNGNDNDVQYLKHYTQLPALISILETMTLIPGRIDNWKDKNDKAAVEAYTRFAGAGEARVLSLAYGGEMAHHWYNYAKGKSGCCLMFKDAEFLSRVKNISGVLCGTVDYIAQENLTAEYLKSLDPKEIPFIKRRPFEDEKEYRVILYAPSFAKEPSVSISPIEDCIDNVTLGPDFDPAAAPAIKTLLKDRYNIEVKQSRLNDSKEWIGRFTALTKDNN